MRAHIEASLAIRTNLIDSHVHGFDSAHRRLRVIIFRVALVNRIANLFINDAQTFRHEHALLLWTKLTLHIKFFRKNIIYISC